MCGKYIDIGHWVYACSRCKFKATEKLDLKRHLPNSHIDSKLSCAKCNYMATNKESLTDHHKALQCLGAERTMHAADVDLRQLRNEIWRGICLVHTGRSFLVGNAISRQLIGEVLRTIIKHYTVDMPAAWKKYACWRYDCYWEIRCICLTDTNCA